MLFIDKYVPIRLNEFKFNRDVAEKIEFLAKKRDFPHIIINGAAGVGKKTMANYFIQCKYRQDESDCQAFVTKNQIYEIKPNTKAIDVFVKYSQYHWQINPSISGVYDRIIIQKLILNIISSRPIGIDYNIIVIEEADKLSIDAQQCLRRILEKYVDNSRFIFLVNNQSSLIPALVSRCVSFRLSAPNDSQTTEILNSIAKIESIAIPPTSDHLKTIISTYQRNIKTAMHMLQCPDLIISPESIIINKIAGSIIHTKQLQYSQKIECIAPIREQLYDLLVHCLDIGDILKMLYLQLIKSPLFAHKCVELTDFLTKYEHSSKFGNKPIYHLEAFIISAMSLL
jgi:DNA polymerase III delta prime subunit